MIMKSKIKSALPTSIGVALLPPIWAVLSELCGIKFGWIALAAGGVYVAAGDDIKDAVKISGGFFMACIWGYIATKIFQCYTDINHYLLLFSVLCIMGFICSLLAFTILEKVTYLPSWLGGWAIALGTFGETDPNFMGITFIKLLIAMLAGVWYIGAFNNCFQKYIRKKMNKE